MKIFNKLAKVGHDKLFNIRCDIRPGIRYFDESHFPGLIKENYEMKNDNGYILRGGYYHFDKYQEDTIIIFCHGMGGGHQAYMKEINYLARNGFKVLSIDYQGTILSEGPSLGGLSQALYDMNTLVNNIKGEYKNIYVIGHSWGGWVAQGLCKLNPEITKIVTLAGMNSLLSLVNQYFPWYIAFLKKPMLRLEKEKYGEISTYRCYKTLNERPNLKGLLIQSKNDGILFPKYNLELIQAKNKNPNVEIIFNEDRYHNPQYSKEAVKKLTNYLHNLNKLKDPLAIKKLADETNWDELCELDENVMHKIIKFYQS